MKVWIQNIRNEGVNQTVAIPLDDNSFLQIIVRDGFIRGHPFIVEDTLNPDALKDYREVDMDSELVERLKELEKAWIAAGPALRFLAPHLDPDVKESR